MQIILYRIILRKNTSEDMVSFTGETIAAVETMATQFNRADLFDTIARKVLVGNEWRNATPQEWPVSEYRTI